jgi:hypothetical protein
MRKDPMKIFSGSVICYATGIASSLVWVVIFALLTYNSQPIYCETQEPFFYELLDAIHIVAIGMSIINLPTILLFILFFLILNKTQYLRIYDPIKIGMFIGIFSSLITFLLVQYQLIQADLIPISIFHSVSTLFFLILISYIYKRKQSK